MPRHLWHRFSSRWKREDLILSARLALVAVAAMLVARTLGLHSFYWAGISAIVVSTGRPGGSFVSSLTRAGGTVVGLLCGLGAVLALGHSFVAAALAIPVSILLCRALGLKAAIKVSALTTLFPISTVADLHGLGPTLLTSYSRAENVLLGCLVTMVLDGLLWPDRISRKLQKLLRLEIGRVGSLTADLLEAYEQGRAMAAGPDLAILKHARNEHLRLLEKLLEEPEDALAPREQLTEQVHWVHELVDYCSALEAILQRVEGDKVQDLVQGELTALAETIRAAGRCLERGNPGAPETLALAGGRARLETAFEAVRGDRGTQAYPAPEVFRLLGVLHLASEMAEGFVRLAALPDPEALTVPR